jgi:EAL domain-containing protein (putative c-di-GMP-specific phosphodiesterase class I)
MKLRNQLFLAICLFLLVAFSGSFFVGLESSREQTLGQLRAHAQDAATALGLSLTARIDDPAMMELMVSSIFDSGYFSNIRIISIDNQQVLIERSASSRIKGVPGWFVSLVNLHHEGGDALIMRGWEQVARVEVLSNPQFALAKLWDSTVGSLIWLLVCGLLSAVLGGWLLRRQLRPLDNMVRQAEAISKREFFNLPKLPRTPELKRVVLAMNQMVEKLKALFSEEAARSEKLRSESYQDSQTGLANRRLLDEQMADHLPNAPTQAVLHHKVLARLLDPQGQAIAAGQFLPWVERFGWSARFDLAMLEATFDYLAVNRWPLALSLSGGTLRDQSQLNLIFDMLESLPELAPLLTLEIDERQLPPPDELQRLSHCLLATGYRIGLQHFGGSFSQIGNLTQLGLAYLKIDGAYIRHIDQQRDKRLFIEAIFRATNSIDLPLIAEMVETQGELEAIRELGVFGVMGRLIGPPEPM